MRRSCASRYRANPPRRPREAARRTCYLEHGGREERAGASLRRDEVGDRPTHGTALCAIGCGLLAICTLSVDTSDQATRRPLSGVRESRDCRDASERERLCALRVGVRRYIQGRSAYIRLQSLLLFNARACQYKNLNRRYAQARLFFISVLHAVLI